ncbi:hypothetical protein [Nocardia wallacei]|uniref:hypothetical protein n=1 Tax=Nocardia wallacei TaxID=480035 RepID=UPI002456D252|nr:hypothetical protein [Nocardia wallacei]
MNNAPHISGTVGSASGQLAIRVLRPEISADSISDVEGAAKVGEQLGYTVGEVVEIFPRREGAWATVANAIARTGAAAVIVPDLDHIYGIDHLIRERVRIITVEGERILERAGLTAEFADAARGA